MSVICAAAGAAAAHLIPMAGLEQHAALIAAFVVYLASVSVKGCNDANAVICGMIVAGSPFSLGGLFTPAAGIAVLHAADMGWKMAMDQIKAKTS